MILSLRLRNKFYIQWLHILALIKSFSTTQHSIVAFLLSTRSSIVKAWWWSSFWHFNCSRKEHIWDVKKPYIYIIWCQSFRNVKTLNKNVSCTGCQYASGSNSKYWFWALKSLMPWGWVIWRTISDFICPTHHVWHKVCCGSCMVKSYTWWDSGVWLFLRWHPPYGSSTPPPPFRSEVGPIPANRFGCVSRPGSLKGISWYSFCLLIIILVFLIINLFLYCCFIFFTVCHPESCFVKWTAIQIW